MIYFIINTHHTINNAKEDSMETLVIHSRFITNEQKGLLERKGFKLIQTTTTPSGIFEGDNFEFSVPEELHVYPTICENIYIVLNKGTEILKIYYPKMKTAGIVFFNYSSNYWG